MTGRIIVVASHIVWQLGRQFLVGPLDCTSAAWPPVQQSCAVKRYFLVHMRAKKKKDPLLYTLVPAGQGSRLQWTSILVTGSRLPPPPCLPPSSFSVSPSLPPSLLRKRPQRCISRTFYSNSRWLRRPGPWPGAGAVTACRKRVPVVHLEKRHPGQVRITRDIPV